MRYTKNASSSKTRIGTCEKALGITKSYLLPRWYFGAACFQHFSFSERLFYFRVCFVDVCFVCLIPVHVLVHMNLSQKAAKCLDKAFMFSWVLCFRITSSSSSSLSSSRAQHHSSHIFFCLQKIKIKYNFCLLSPSLFLSLSLLL